MNLIRYQNPELYPLRQIDSLFQEAFSGFSTNSLFNSLFPSRESKLETDMYENEDNYYLRFELPGFDKQDVNLSIEGYLLSIKAEHKEKDKEASVQRSLLVPDSAEADKVSASLKNGLLTVTLPKSKETKHKSITIS